MKSVGHSFIVIEGPDGAGKSAVGDLLYQRMLENGRRVKLLSFPGRHEGTVGALVYKLHHDPAAFGISSMSSTALQALHIAAHLDAIEFQITPLINDGYEIILDRYWWSTWVYGLTSGVPRNVLHHLVAAEKAMWGVTQPTHLIYIHREEPLKSVETELWLNLRQEYAKLAEVESRSTPVYTVANTSSATATSEKIWQIVNAAAPEKRT